MDKTTKQTTNNNNDDSIEYVDDDVIEALENQPDNMEPADSESGFETIDEGSTVKDDDSFIDGDIEKNETDAIVSFNDHQDSVYCVACVEEPKKDGQILFLSGDGRDKAIAWTVAKRGVL